MKIGTVLTATNLDPLYCDFIPIFIKAWSILLPEADVVIVLIGDEIPEEYKQYKKLIKLFSPLPNMHTGFQAQVIRLFYPSLIEKDAGVLITDMDMIPLNRNYYVKSIETIDNDAFVSYRDALFPSEFPMCYNVAHPKIWGALFEKLDMKDALIKWYDKNYIWAGAGWGRDQEKLMEYYNKYTGKKLFLTDKDTGFTRLDRTSNILNDLPRLEKLIRLGRFADYHCERPYKTHMKLNDLIVSWLEPINPRLIRL